MDIVFDEDEEVSRSIKKAVCRFHFYADGECTACHSESECERLVEKTLDLTKRLSKSRNPSS